MAKLLIRFVSMEGTVVIVDADPRTQRQFASASDAELVACDSARAGLNACCAIEPACVIIGSDLSRGSDQASPAPGAADAAWLAQSLRSQPAGVSQCVIVALMDEDDEAEQLRLLSAGVDVCMRRPRRADVLVAAVEAVRLAVGRGRAGAGASSSTPTTRRPSSSNSRRGAALSGRIDDAAAMVALRQIENGQRTGELHFTERGRSLILEFASGVLIGGRCDERAVSPAEAIREALQWMDGEFAFQKRAARPAPPGYASLSYLLSHSDLREARSVRRKSGFAPSVDPPRHVTPRSGAVTATGTYVRRETLVSQPAVTPPASKRSSDRIRTGIRVESSPPSVRTNASRKADPRAESDDEVIIADNTASSRRG